LEKVTKGSSVRIARSRIESLSDIIFGLALAISSIPLISRLPAKPFGILIDLAEFGFSFLILMSVWVGYTNIMSVLPLEDTTTLNLNLASTLYALDMMGLMLILALFTHQLAQEEKGLVPKESMKQFKRVGNTLYLSAALFAVSILPIFWSLKLDGQPIRFYFWFIPLILSSLIRISERQFPE